MTPPRNPARGLRVGESRKFAVSGRVFRVIRVAHDVWCLEDRAPGGRNTWCGNCRAIDAAVAEALTKEQEA